MKPILLKLSNPYAGDFVVVPDADGQSEIEQTMKRSEATDGVVYEYILDLQFTRGAHAYLGRAYKLGGGIEALVDTQLYEYSPNDFMYFLIGQGNIKFTNREFDYLRFKTSLEAGGLQRQVLNALDSDVDIDTIVSQGGIALPATPVLTLQMHSKKIVKQALNGPTDGLEFQATDVFEIVVNNGGGSQYHERLILIQVDNQRQAFDEYGVFSIPYGYDVFEGVNLATYTPSVEDNPGTIAAYKLFLQNNPLPRFEIKRIEQIADAGTGVLNLRWNLKHFIDVGNTGGDVDICGSGALGKTEITYWLEIRDTNDVVKVLEYMGAYDIPGCGDNERIGTGVDGFQSVDYTLPVTLALGDKLYVYGLWRVFGSYGRPSLTDGHLNHSMRITAKVAPEDVTDLTLMDYTFEQLIVDTVFPETTAKTYLVYEALNKMFQFYTDKLDCFRSAYFGRTDTIFPYVEDGPGSLRALAPGAFIRGLADRKAFVNGNDFYGSLNMMDCLGMGFRRLESGQEIVEIEPLSKFYDKNNLILDLGVVGKLKTKTLIKQYQRTVEFAYPKVDIEKTNGLDEPNTMRRYTFPLTQVANKLTIQSKYKTAGAEIEDQRRKSVTTEDSKNDAANFLIDLVREGGTFRPRRDDGFTEVTGYHSPETAYNLAFTPRRRIINWGRSLAIALYLSFSKVLSFSYGEGNYTMGTKRTGETELLTEDSNFDLTTIEPDIEPDGYGFECQLSSKQMATIRGNPYGYFKFREFKNSEVLEGYLSSVKRKTSNNLATFELIKVYRITSNV